MKIQRTHRYEFYLLSGEKVLFLEDDCIVDANIDLNEKSGKNYLILETDDEFFLSSVVELLSEDYFVILQVFELDESFSHQFELSGEFFEKISNSIKFRVENISTNHIYPTVNPFWQIEIEDYKSKRASFLRDSKIENILE